MILSTPPANTDQTTGTALCAATSKLCKGVEGLREEFTIIYSVEGEEGQDLESDNGKLL